MFRLGFLDVSHDLCLDRPNRATDKIVSQISESYLKYSRWMCFQRNEWNLYYKYNIIPNYVFIITSPPFCSFPSNSSPINKTKSNNNTKTHKLLFNIWKVAVRLGQNIAVLIQLMDFFVQWAGTTVEHRNPIAIKRWHQFCTYWAIESSKNLEAVLYSLFKK